MQRQQRKRLGDILIDARVLDNDQLAKGLEVAKKEKLPLGKTLVKLGFITQLDIIVALSEQLSIPYISLNNYQIDTNVLPLIPEDLARQNNLIPLFKIGNQLTIAMVDPLNVFVIDEISRITGLEVEPAVCTEEELKQSYEQYYGDDAAKQEMKQIIEDAHEGDEIKEEIETLEISDSSDSAPVIKLVNLVLSQAVKEKVSDIHIEPEEECLRVRYRTDGILHEAFTQPKNLQNAIISRVKIMSELNIAERRVPQDGRVQIKIDGHDIDIRVSTLPTVHGENIVMRILDKTNLIVNIDETGMTSKVLKQFKDLLARPYGIILATGPTGSGKTTTLYSALNALNSEDRNIVTVEDPVEYRLKMIRQSQVNPKAGMTFASGLRAILRQDPDIVMVGEIRDAETASVAVQAALTGHLVLSTLHTNDAPGAVNRLIDMGVEPFLVSSATSGIVAQRLVRRICDKCKEEYKPADALLKSLKIPTNGKKVSLYRGAGCRMCKNTGYRGRMALFELLTLDDDMKNIVLKKESATYLKNFAVKRGFKTLRHDGLFKALKGFTTIEEVLRVAGNE